MFDLDKCCYENDSLSIPGELAREPDSCRLAWTRQPFRAWGAPSPFRNATRCDLVVWEGGNFYWNFAGFQINP